MNPRPVEWLSWPRGGHAGNRPAHGDPGAALPRDHRPEGAGRRRSARPLPPDRDRGRPRRHRHRRRRQQLRRLHRRRRLPQRRPCPPPRRRGGAGAGRALLPHRLHDRPVRDLRRARRAAHRARAVLRPGQGRVLQRRHRGGRERRQVRARLHAPAGRDRLRRRVPRPHAPLAHAHVEDASLQGGARAVRARGLPRPVPGRVPRHHGPRRTRRARARALDAGRRRDGRRDRRRAGAGRGRLHPRAARVHGGAARDLRPRGDPARRRRGADRLRADRTDVRRSSTTASSRT